MLGARTERVQIIKCREVRCMIISILLLLLFGGGVIIITRSNHGL